MPDIVLVAIAVAAAGGSGLLGLRYLDLRHRAASRLTYSIGLPRNLSAEAVQAFVRGLAGIQLPRWRRALGLPAVVWETGASEERIGFTLHVEAGSTEYVLAQLRASIPSVRVEQAAHDPARPLLAAELRLSNAHRMLAVEQPESISAALLATLRPLRTGERVSVQRIISPATSPGPVVTKSHAKASTDPATAVLQLFSGRKPQAPRDRAERDKLIGPHFMCSARIGIWADDVARCRHLLRRVLGGFHTLNAAGVSLRRRVLPNLIVARRMAKGATPLVSYPAYLNARELAALLSFPLGEIALAGLDLGRSRQLPPPIALPTSGPAFARSNYHGSDAPLTFGLSSLRYHAWVIGATGSGKSTLLANLLAAYMNLDATIVILDSKRDLVRDVIDLIPAHRAGDLVLLDPADDTPIGLNLFAGAASEADRIADHLVGVFVRLWGTGNVGPRSQDILRACFMTLALTPGATLVELPLLLQDESFRRRLVSKLDDPIVLGPQWGAFEALSPAERAQHIAAPLNKVRAILARRALRDIVGQSQGLDVAEVLSRRSILAIPLSKGLIGDDSAALLGSIVLLRVWQALSARVSLASSERRPTLVVLDEFQDYLSIPLSFADMLAQARGLGVGVVAAHQHLGQVPTPLRADLRANARTKIAFGLSAADARVFAQELRPHLSADDLQGLGRYEVAAQVCVDAEVLPPATGVTLPPPASTGAGDKARALSRERYGRPRAEIEADIRRRHGERPGTGSVGTRRPR